MVSPGSVVVVVVVGGGGYWVPHGAMHLESSRGGSVRQPLCGVSQNQPSPRWAQSALVVQSGRLQ